MTYQDPFPKRSSASEDMRELSGRDQDVQAKKRLKTLIEDGLNSGHGRVLTTLVAEQLKDRALGGRR
jgi:antitoxin ParD1/3/4